MSIAISVTVHPSKGLHIAVCGMCFCIALAGCSVGLGLIGAFSIVVRTSIAFACVICASFALFQIYQREKSFRLDISGIGNIRMKQYEDGQLARMPQESAFGRDGEVVRLMAGSTIWPGLMFLHLQSENGRMTVLRILPDSISHQEFRALLVACRWIAARRNELNDLNNV